jgi:hypothetical protein
MARSPSLRLTRSLLGPPLTLRANFKASFKFFLPSWCYGVIVVAQYRGDHHDAARCGRLDGTRNILPAPSR